MDKPKIKLKQQAKKVLTELKKAIREGRIFPEKQGRRIKKKSLSTRKYRQRELEGLEY
jgi:hypothetical protein